jgi:hypothetical protein
MCGLRRTKGGPEMFILRDSEKYWYSVQIANNSERETSLSESLILSMLHFA